MIYPKVPPLTEITEQPRRTCQICGPFTDVVEIRFDSGSVEPTVGETVTGATSGDTGVVVEAVLESGTYAGGDAAGTISMSSPTGFSDQDLWGTDDEALNGSTSGDDMMTLNDNGFRKSVGRLWPEGELIKREGKYYCHEHYRFKFHMKDMLDTPFQVKDTE